jgi:hypothetical protein
MYGKRSAAARRAIPGPDRPVLIDGFLASTGLDLTPFRNPRH